MCADIDFPFPGIVGERRPGARRRALIPPADPWLPQRSVWPLLGGRRGGTSTSPGWLRWPNTSATPETVQGGGSGFSSIRHVADLFDRYAVHRPELVREWAEAAGCRRAMASGRWSCGAGCGPASGSRARRSVSSSSCTAPPRRARVAGRIHATFVAVRADPPPGELPRCARGGWVREKAKSTSSFCIRRRRCGRSSSPPWARRLAHLAAVPKTPRRGAATPVAAVVGPGSPGNGAGARLSAIPHGERYTEGGPARRRRHCCNSCRTTSGPTAPPAGSAGGEVDRRALLADDDDSIRVHSCHGRGRQVEVLRDAILHLLEDDPSLEPAGHHSGCLRH